MKLLYTTSVDLHHLSGDQLNEAAARETSDKALQELKSG